MACVYFFSEARQRWLHALQNLQLFKLEGHELSNYEVCGDHFEAHDYNSKSRRSKLRDNVVPHKNLAKGKYCTDPVIMFPLHT